MDSVPPSGRSTRASAILEPAARVASLDTLIVDDDEIMCARLEKLLEEDGKGALSVTSLDSARQAIKAVHFRLVILDRRLGDGDGLQLCAEYRTRYAEKGAYILMLSAADSAADRMLGLAAGADDYVSKRCGDQELLRRVNDLYDRAVAHAHRSR